jgi:glutamate synthase (NADPH/NADH) large chain
MMRVCHLNTCPPASPRRTRAAREVHRQARARRELHALHRRGGARDHGAARLPHHRGDGRPRRPLEPKQAVEHWKARASTSATSSTRPTSGPTSDATARIKQDHGLDKSLDLTTLLDICAPAIERGEKVVAELPIRNVNRVVGTITGSEVTKKWGAKGLPEDTIRIRFKGSAGQSFGAFMPRGMTFSIEGDANDYVGKGLSGGKIIVRPPAATFKAEENIIIGNVALYGATAGEAYIRGMAGERFAVRNSASAPSSRPSATMVANT